MFLFMCFAFVSLFISFLFIFHYFYFLGSLSRSQTTVIFINQLRSKIGVMYGNPEVTAGGNALKFYSSVRIDIRRKEVLKENDGIMVKIKVVKNKVRARFLLSSLQFFFFLIHTFCVPPSFSRLLPHTVMIT